MLYFVFLKGNADSQFDSKFVFCGLTLSWCAKILIVFRKTDTMPEKTQMISLKFANNMSRLNPNATQTFTILLIYFWLLSFTMAINLHEQLLPGLYSRFARCKNLGNIFIPLWIDHLNHWFVLKTVKYRFGAEKFHFIALKKVYITCCDNILRIVLGL